MIAKLSIVEEEADECIYWMELLVEAGLVPEVKLKKLMADVNEIVAMTVRSIKTLRSKPVPLSPKSKTK
jgi:four helix bundle protein